MSRPEVSFRSLTDADVMMIWQWRNKDRIRNNMITVEPIPWKEHLNWFINMRSKKDQHYFMYCVDQKPFGVLYFVEINSESCFWGCYVGEDAVFPGSGLILAVAALDFAAFELNLDDLNAEVFDFNKAPQNMNRLLGYEYLGTRTDKTKPDEDRVLLLYRYRLEDWRVNRSDIMNTLPRPIREICNHLKFKR